MVLTKVARKENAQAAEDKLEQIAVESNRNLRKALLMLEAGHVQNSLSGVSVPLTDWEQYVKQIASMMLEQQTPAA